MQAVGIKELKNNLSRYLLLVKSGEDLLITERGRAIARIIPERDGVADEAGALAALAARGLVRLPEAAEEEQEPELVEIRGRPLSETVLEGRR